MNEKRAAIYHFTNGSANRPIIYLKELERIKQYATIVGYPDAEVYLDKSLRKKEQIQLQKLLFEMNNYQALIMKDFYHLRKNTGAIMSDLIALGSRGVNVYTLEDGNFKLEQAPFEQSLRVAIYYCGLEIVGRSIELQFQIMEYFIQVCTKWKLIDEYADISGNKLDGNQLQLQELITNRDKYDIILVQSFNDIHWRTAKFCKVRHQIQKDIYSMHEEMYLRYEREVGHEE